MTDAQQPAKGRQAAFGFIFAVALMNSLSFGIMIPVLPLLVKDLSGGDTASAADWNVVFGATWGLMQFVIGPVLGMLSDRYGRRPVLLLSVFGLGVDFLFMALAPSLWWLLVGRIFNGATASSFSTANAYVADVTPPDKRARVFGIMGSAFSFGFLIGPFLGGYLNDQSLNMTDPVILGFTLEMAHRLPFYVAAAITLVNFLYGVFVLPESLPPERRAARFDWSKANPVGSLVLLASHRQLIQLAAVGFLFQLAHMVLPSIFVLYTEHRYGWSGTTMGATMTLSGILGIVVQVLLVGPFVKRFGERGTLLTGIVFGMLGFSIYAWAPTGWLYLVGTPFFALMGLLVPGLMGMMTRRVDPSEQGRLQGANQSLQGIASIFGPVLFGMTFAWSVRHESTFHVPGFAVFIAAVLLAGALVIATTVARTQEAEPQPA